MPRSTSSGRSIEATALAPSRSMARNVLANLLAALLDRLRRCARPDQVLIAPRAGRRARRRARRPSTARCSRTTRSGICSCRRSTSATCRSRGSSAIRSCSTRCCSRCPGSTSSRARYRRALVGLEPENRAIQPDPPGSRRSRSSRSWSSRSATARSTRLQERLSLLADTCVAQAAAWHAPAARLDAVDVGDRGAGQARRLGAHRALGPRPRGALRGDSADSDTFVAFQRFVEDMERCLEEPTEDGVAYHVDTRLRPEGRKGALAIPVSMFQRYLGLARRDLGAPGVDPLPDARRRRRRWRREVEDSVRRIRLRPMGCAHSRLHDGHPRPDGARAGRSLAEGSSTSRSVVAAWPTSISSCR